MSQVKNILVSEMSSFGMISPRTIFFKDIEGKCARYLPVSMTNINDNHVVDFRYHVHRLEESGIVSLAKTNSSKNLLCLIY